MRKIMIGVCLLFIIGCEPLEREESIYIWEGFLKDGTHCAYMLHSGSAITCNWKKE